MNATVKVWDPLVRLFHWTLAGLFLANFFTEEGDPAHRWIGYATIVLVAIRIAWGLIGTRHARFSDWVPSPRRVCAYLRDRLAGRSQRRLGHNPGAAVMILTLLAGVLLVGLTGWLLTTDAFWGSGWMEGLHEVLAYGVLGLVGIHVLAAIGESWHYRENLIAAMIHGRKRALDPPRTGQPGASEIAEDQSRETGLRLGSRDANTARRG